MELARPYHGPYEVVGSPQSGAILVALGRIRRCPEEMTDETWTGLRPSKPKQSPKKYESNVSKENASRGLGSSVTWNPIDEGTDVTTRGQ